MLKSCPNGSWILEGPGSVGTGLSHCGVRCLTGAAGPLQPQSGGARGWLCAVCTLSPAWPSQHVWQRGKRRQLETLTGRSLRVWRGSQKSRGPSEEYPILACQPGEGRSGHWVTFGLIPVAMPHFSLLGCHPQNRAHLCLLSHLWENLAFYLPILLSVCCCLSGSLCLRVRGCASCCCGPMTTSSAGRKK